MKYIIAALLLSSTFLYGESRRFGGIEFKGFHAIAERTLVTACDIKKDGNAIVADPESIKVFLSRERFVKKFSVDAGKKLRITIEERSSAFRVCVLDKQNYYAELSSEGEIISSGTLYSDNPLVTVSRTALSGRVISGMEGDALNALVSSTESLLRGELSEIDLTDPQKAVLIFKNRRTHFITAVNPSSLQRIAALLGYFDKAAYYPETVNIIGDSAVLH